MNVINGFNIYNRETNERLKAWRHGEWIEEKDEHNQRIKKKIVENASKRMKS